MLLSFQSNMSNLIPHNVLLAVTFDDWSSLVQFSVATNFQPIKGFIPRARGQWKTLKTKMLSHFIVNFVTLFQFCFAVSSTLNQFHAPKCEIGDKHKGSQRGLRKIFNFPKIGNS